MNRSIKLLMIVSVLCFSVISGFGQAIKIDDTGKVGIGGVPGYSTLSVNGTFQTTGKVSLYSSLLYLPNRNLKIYGYGGRVNVGIGDDYSSDATLKVASEGNLYALKVEGEAQSTGGYWTVSDKKFKKEIKAIRKEEKIYSKLMQLEPRSYYFKTKEELMAMNEAGEINFRNDTVYSIDSITGDMKMKVKKDIPRFSSRKQYGLIASELEAIFPEMVMTDPKTNLKAVNYTALIPVLIETIKEQDARIAALEAKIQ